MSKHTSQRRRDESAVAHFVGAIVIACSELIW